MKLHGFTPVVSFGNTRLPKDTYRAAIRPHQCVVEFLHPPLRRKTGVAPGLAHPRPYGWGIRLKMELKKSRL